MAFNYFYLSGGSVSFLYYRIETSIETSIATSIQTSTQTLIETSIVI